MIKTYMGIEPLKFDKAPENVGELAERLKRTMYLPTGTCWRDIMNEKQDNPPPWRVK